MREAAGGDPADDQVVSDLGRQDRKLTRYRTVGGGKTRSRGPRRTGKQEGTQARVSFTLLLGRLCEGGESGVSTPCRPPANSTQPSSPTAHSGLQALRRTIIGSKTTILNLPCIVTDKNRGGDWLRVHLRHAAAAAAGSLCSFLLYTDDLLSLIAAAPNCGLENPRRSPFNNCTTATLTFSSTPILISSSHSWVSITLPGSSEEWRGLIRAEPRQDVLDMTRY